MYDGKKVGSIGDIGTFSFYPAHQMTTIEGGAISTNNVQLDFILRSLKFWGKAVPCRFCGTNFTNSCPVKHNLFINDMGKYDPSFLFLTIGHNVKMIELQGALGVEQLKMVEKFNETRRENFNFIVKTLKPFENLL